MGHDDFQEYFSFAFVRNPFDRLSSLYRFLKSWRGLPERQAIRFEKFNSFQDFLQDDIWLDDGWLFDPQTKWLALPSSQRSPMVSFVGKLENFDKDLDIILKKIAPDVKINTDVRKNISPRPKAEIWAGVDVDRVVRRYESDFITFNYSRTPPN